MCFLSQPALARGLCQGLSLLQQCYFVILARTLVCLCFRPPLCRGSHWLGSSRLKKSHSGLVHNVQIGIVVFFTVAYSAAVTRDFHVLRRLEVLSVIPPDSSSSPMFNSESVRGQISHLHTCPLRTLAEVT